MDAIVALATPWGRSGVALVRLSGPQARDIAAVVCPGGPPWRARRASLRRAPDIDTLLVVWMPGPNSFTGEDVVELSCHGNPVIVELLLSALITAGARMARPGEFTRRALLNGRTTLLAAEALERLIAARSPAGVALARAGMSGVTAERAAALRESLLDLTAELEARLDHPGEDLGYEEDAAVVAALRGIAASASAAAQSWGAGRVRLLGAEVALIGPVNAGKSSLFNRLLGEERALVSPIPGTTRDVVERSFLLDGLEVRLLDTAGEREQASDAIEAAGIALGHRMTAEVDLLLVVLPLHQPLSPESHALLSRTAGRPRLIIGTHADALRGSPPLPTDCIVNGQTGEGVDSLLIAIKQRLSVGERSGEALVVLSQRQHDLFQAVAAHTDAAADALEGVMGPAIAAEETTAALERLAELSGERVREAVLDRLFSRFCIGK